MSINSVSISGNLVRDCELRSTQSGTQVLTFTVAVNDRKRNPQSGQWEDVANFIPCVVFGNRAESLSRILAKGMKTSVLGKLRQSSYKDKSGQNRSKIEVIVDDVEFMSQPKGSQTNSHASQQQTQQPTASQSDMYDSEIPF